MLSKQQVTMQSVAHSFSFKNGSDAEDNCCRVEMSTITL